MNKLSAAARKFRAKVGDPSSFHATCDGGDPGTPDRRTIWVLGIEPGWSLADQAADEHPDPAAAERLAQYGIDLQIPSRPCL